MRQNPGPLQDTLLQTAIRRFQAPSQWTWPRQVIHFIAVKHSFQLKVPPRFYPTVHWWRWQAPGILPPVRMLILIFVVRGILLCRFLPTVLRLRHYLDIPGDSRPGSRIKNFSIFLRGNLWVPPTARFGTKRSSDNYRILNSFLNLIH